MFYRSRRIGIAKRTAEEEIAARSGHAGRLSFGLGFVNCKQLNKSNY